MFLITVKNLNIILVVYLVKKLIINNVEYTSKGSGVYVQWGWRIRPMGVAYTSNGGGVYIQWGWRIHPMGVAYTSNGGGVYVQWTYTSKGPLKWFNLPQPGNKNHFDSQPSLVFKKKNLFFKNKKHRLNFFFQTLTIVETNNSVSENTCLF